MWGRSPAQLASTLPETPPMSFGAASRPIDAPVPITISEITDVKKHRRSERLPSPLQTASSISEFSYFR